MKTELISVGTEILLGNILNTNAKYLSEKCAEFGLSVFYQTSVGDNPVRLKETVAIALERSDCIIFTGGLGPTNDDLTKETICELLDIPLVEDEKAKTDMENRLLEIHAKITENNYKQALVPENSIVLYNNHGTAPGLIIEKNSKVVILLPGPPMEMSLMFSEYVEPYFKSRNRETIYSKTVKLIGIGESSAADVISDILENSVNPTVAPYAKMTQVHLRITAKGINEEECKKLIEPTYKEIKKRLGEYIYTDDVDSEIEDVVVRLLKENNLTIATAESCTGGLLSGRIVNVSGASDCFNEGYVVYSNEAKIKNLGVKKETIEKFGAVSNECAMEMARGAAINANADIGVSTTGFAGPDGGTEENPVGTVYIGIYFKGKTTAYKLKLGHSREMIREAAVIRALNLVFHLFE